MFGVCVAMQTDYIVWVEACEGEFQVRIRAACEGDALMIAQQEYPEMTILGVWMGVPLYSLN